MGEEASAALESGNLSSANFVREKPLSFYSVDPRESVLRAWRSMDRLLVGFLPQGGCCR